MWRTEDVPQAEGYNIPAQLARLEAGHGIDLILRSSVWLAVRDSRASFQIEREQGQEDIAWLRLRAFNGGWQWSNLALSDQ